MPRREAELVIRYHDWIRHVPLRDRAVVLGRADDCDVVLDDRRISRHHCRLTPSGDGQWTLENLSSQVGTLIEGSPIDGPRAVGIDERFQIGPMSVCVQWPPLSSLLSGDVERDARTVNVLLTTIDELYGLPSTEAVLETIVDRAILLAEADRGAILVTGDGPHLEAAVARSREGEDLAAHEVLTRSLPQRVLHSREPIVLTDVADADDLPQSVVEGALRSIVCVPIPGGEQPLGVLYADGRQPVRRFGAAELAALEALALHGALALERARLREEEQRVTHERQRRLSDEVEALRARLGTDTPIGHSAPMRAALDVLRRVASSDATILLTGETGTGKEVLARYVHRLSPRAKAPFVVIDCGAIPEGLIESELFGHERGAFTGATTASDGRFREANGGTVFLDEIAELPLLLQTRLLRVLQERTVQPVGAKGRVPVNVRVLCATHHDLAANVASGRFREDLYYRVAVLPVEVPALRQRGDDIVLLAQYFLHRFASTVGAHFSGFTREAHDALHTHGWPGNVRELENRVHRAVILAQPPYITRADLGLGQPGAGAAPPLELEVALPPLQTARAEATARFEKHYLHEALRRANGNVTRAAQLAGVTRGLLQRMLREHGIDRTEFIPPRAERDADAAV